MAFSYYNRELCGSECEISKEDFVAGWVLYEKSVGRLRDRKVLISSLVFLFAASVIFLVGGMINFVVAALTAIISLCAIVYFWRILPQKVCETAEFIYEKGKDIFAKQNLTVTCEGFIYENRYEKISGFWSETAFLAQDNDYFVFCENRDRNILILRKNSVEKEKIGEISDKLKEIFYGRYKYFN